MAMIVFVYNSNSHSSSSCDYNSNGSRNSGSFSGESGGTVLLTEPDAVYYLAE